MRIFVAQSIRQTRFSVLRRLPRAMLTAAFAFGLALGLMPSGHVALACSCLQVPPSEALDKNDAVFRGTVRALRRVRERDEPVRLVWGVAEIDIVTTWKGDLGSRVEVVTTGNLGLCGYPFRLDEDIIVYATHDDEPGLLYTNMCRRTRSYDPAEEEALDALAPPPPTATPNPGVIPTPAPTAVQCPGCPRPIPDLEAVARHDAVFLGQVSGVWSVGQGRERDYIVDFEVLQIWKGDALERESLRVPFLVWECGIAIDQLHRNWLIFADYDESGATARYRLAQCTPTMRFDREIAQGLGDSCEPPRIELQPPRITLRDQGDEGLMRVRAFGIAPMTVTVQSEPEGIVHVAPCYVPQDSKQCSELRVRALATGSKDPVTAILHVVSEGERCICMNGSCGPGPGIARSWPLMVTVGGAQNEAVVYLPWALR